MNPWLNHGWVLKTLKCAFCCHASDGENKKLPNRNNLTNKSAVMLWTLSLEQSVLRTLEAGVSNVANHNCLPVDNGYGYWIW